MIEHQILELILKTLVAAGVLFSMFFLATYIVMRRP